MTDRWDEKAGQIHPHTCDPGTLGADFDQRRQDSIAAALRDAYAQGKADGQAESDRVAAALFASSNEAFAEAKAANERQRAEIAELRAALAAAANPQ